MTRRCFSFKQGNRELILSFNDFQVFPEFCDGEPIDFVLHFSTSSEEFNGVVPREIAVNEYLDKAEQPGEAVLLVDGERVLRE